MSTRKGEVTLAIPTNTPSRVLTSLMKVVAYSVDSYIISVTGDIDIDHDARVFPDIPAIIRNVTSGWVQRYRFVHSGEFYEMQYDGESYAV